MKGVIVMKKLICCLLVVVMLFTAVSALAESKGRFEKNDALRKFLRETDWQTKDIALQIHSGERTSEIVIRGDKENIHLVSRKDAVEKGHVQLNPTGLYVGADGNVTLLRYATVTTVMDEIVKGLDEMLEQAVQSIPDEELPEEAEVEAAISKMAIATTAAAAQEQADALTLSSAAMDFADKFKPENILDVKEEAGAVQISLRSEAFASALAEAMDEMMMNADLAELVDRKAGSKNGSAFAEAQKNWLTNREATLEAVRSIQSTETLENGHWVSHFQIGGEDSEEKALICNKDVWVNEENGAAEATVSVGRMNEAPSMVYEFAVNPYTRWEKLTAGDSTAEIQLNIEDDQISNGRVVVIEGNEELRADFGPDYLYVKGPKGGISTSVRETWTGKTRYELVAENAEGEEKSVTVDFYQDADSLVCELNSSESTQPAMLKLSRIDKLNIEDLSASENINEITVEKINAELENLLKLATGTDK